MSARRDILLLGGLFGALVLFIAFGPARQPPPPPEAPTTYSTGQRGAEALYRWVGQIGLRAERLQFQEFDPGDDADALVILSPPDPLTSEEAEAALAWVERGGTLILADDSAALSVGARELLDALQIDTAVFPDAQIAEQAAAAQPALDTPPAGEAQLEAARHLVLSRDDYAALLVARGEPVLVGIQHGAGYVYVSASAHPFTNDGLRDERNARLVLNLLRRVPSGGLVLFDEIHHGYARPPAPAATALGTPWGWAAAYALVVVAAYLILSGRRFGRPVPLREERRSRSSAEYVESMADLLQRGGKGADMLQHYHQRLRRRLAQRYGVSPSLDDAELARELARAGGLAEDELRQLLRRLAAGSPSEAELLRAVADADAYARASGLGER